MELYIGMFSKRIIEALFLNTYSMYDGALYLNVLYRDIGSSISDCVVHVQYNGALYLNVSSMRIIEALYLNTYSMYDGALYLNV
jgi:hypothetical protein